MYASFALLYSQGLILYVSDFVIFQSSGLGIWDPAGTMGCQCLTPAALIPPVFYILPLPQQFTGCHWKLCQITAEIGKLSGKGIE